MKEKNYKSKLKPVTEPYSPAPFKPVFTPVLENNPYKHRDAKIGSLIHEIASEFVQIESNYQSLITVTRVLVGEKAHTALILITVLPEDKAHGVVDFLKRKRGEFRDYFGNKVRNVRPPTFDFDLDPGEHNKIEDIKPKNLE